MYLVSMMFMEVFILFHPSPHHYLGLRIYVDHMIVVYK